MDDLEMIKISDFGSAKNAQDETAGAVTELAGTPMYMAPEVIRNGEKGRFGSQDIWAVGCVILEMVTGKRPWSHLENEWSIMYHSNLPY